MFNAAEYRAEFVSTKDNISQSSLLEQNVFNIPLFDFSPNVEESNFYHSHSMKTKPYLSLSKYLFVFFCKNKSIPQEMIKGSIYKLSHLHQLASRVLLPAMAS